MDASSSERQGLAGPRQDVQPVHSRLDQLLRQLLPDAVASDPEEDRSLCHPLGAPQVQAVASEDQGGARLVRPATPSKSNALCTLAAHTCTRQNTRRRMYQ